MMATVASWGMDPHACTTPPTPAPGIHVLVVEDQHDIAANIWDFLERRGYIVDHAADGELGLARALHGHFDVIVLDLGLPRLDGLDLCRRLREAGRGVPVLMLTARDSLDDKLRGFAHGADDYMVKPFAMGELEARIRVMHRHGRPSASQPLVTGELRYDPKSMLATRGDRTVALTRAQGAILTVLMQDAPNVIAHRALMRAVWGEDGGDVAALHSHVYELRALLDRPFPRAMIQSVRGIGYRLLAAP
jgi:DNA-binding response OmpR family regulator